jgi:hypothetical protein
MEDDMKRIANNMACTATAVLLTQGCAIVASAPGEHGAEGIGYMLPKALLPVELVHDGSGFDLRILDPKLVGDTAHTYVLQRGSNVFTSDNVVVNVDPKTGLLTGINVKSEDQSAAALTKLVSGLRAEGKIGATDVVVWRALFDPAWLATPPEGPPSESVQSFNQKLNKAAKDYIERLRTDQGCVASAASAATEPCKGLAANAADLEATALSVRVEGAASDSRKPAACGAGFCYRINLPHVVTLSGPGVHNSAVLSLPNRSPTFVMPLERWAFVKTTHDVKLDNGVFQSVTTDRPSSAFAVASVPFDIAKGAVSAASELVQLKIDLSGKEKTLAEAKIKEIESEAALEKALIDKGKGRAESATAPPAAPAPLSIRIGPPATRKDQTANLERGGGNPGEAKPATPAVSGQTSGGSSGTAGAQGR